MPETVPTPTPPRPSQPSRPPSLATGPGLRVSLMPTEQEGERRPDLRRRAIIAAVVLVAEVILLLAGNIIISSRVESQSQAKVKLQQEITGISGQVAEKQKVAKELAVLGQQMGLLAETLDRHVYWTGFFRFLEANTLPTVRYANISGDAATGVFSVDVVADGYRDAVMQIIMLRDNPRVVQVKVSTLSMQTDVVGNANSVNFSMSLKVKPEVWSRSDAASAGSSAAAVPAAAPTGVTGAQ